MSYFKFDRESDYYFSLADISLFNASQKLLLDKLNSLKPKMPEEIIIPPPNSKTVGRPTGYDWNKILSDYIKHNKPPIKPFCRIHNISPKLLRYHLSKSKKPNL